MGNTIDKSLALSAALVVLYCTWAKPHWYWEGSKSLMWRRRFGDRGAEVFLYCLGCILLGLALVMAFK